MMRVLIIDRLLAYAKSGEVDLRDYETDDESIHYMSDACLLLMFEEITCQIATA